MIADRPQVRTHGYAHTIERMAFRADARECLSALLHISRNIQRSLVFFQNLLALGRTLLEQRSCHLTNGRIGIHEKTRLVRVELPRLDVSVLYLLEEQKDSICTSAKGIRRLRPHRRTHAVPLG